MDVYVQRAGGDGDAVLGVGETQDRVRVFRLTFLCGAKVKQGGETHLLRPGLAVCILSDPLDRRGVADIHRHFLTGEIRAGRRSQLASPGVHQHHSPQVLLFG